MEQDRTKTGGASRARRGNPQISMRLELEVIEKLKERLPEVDAGRSGGVAQWIRQLIYRELELGEAPVYAAAPSPRRKRPSI